MRLEVERGSAAGISPSGVALALASAARTARGGGLDFRARGPSTGLRARSSSEMMVTSSELTGFLPSPRCEVGSGVGSGEDPRRILPVGRTVTGSVVGPSVEAHQGRHLAVLGETGMGKSSLLVAVARRALRSEGGLVFDPLGETVEALRSELAPAERRRCVWVAPDGPEISLNALEGIGGGVLDDPVRSERRLNDLVHALRRVRSGRYSDSAYWGPRLEEMLTRALRAAAAYPDGTLHDAHTLLATSARLGRPIPPSAAEAVRELADRIRDRPEDADGARRLLHEVVRSPVLGRMLCAAAPTLRTRDLVAPGRIVLLSGAAARVGESTARYLLSVMLALVWSELLARPAHPKTFVVLDEAQWFSHDSLAEMLRLGRRKNVHVLLATQAIASLPPNVAEAVWTNVSDFVAFRGSPEEAREFARAAPGVTAEAILSLPRGEAAVLLGKGESVRRLRTVRLPGGRPIADSDEPPGLGSGPSPTPGPDAPFPEGARAEPHPRAIPECILDDLVRVDGETPATAPLIVDLASLRQRVDPGGDLVRRAGSALARSGVLVRTDRGEGGARWVLNRSALRGLASSAEGAPVFERPSRTPKPS